VVTGSEAEVRAGSRWMVEGVEAGFGAGSVKGVKGVKGGYWYSTSFY
jgi:hypothetical protein